LPFRNISMLKLLSDKEARLALKMSFPREKNLSTAALEGTGVLNLMKSRISAGSPVKKKIQLFTDFYYSSSLTFKDWCY
jgi:hypothetical protein